MSGSSSETWRWWGNRARHRVVLPLWRGPVSVTAGQLRAACSSLGARSRSITTPRAYMAAISKQDFESASNGWLAVNLLRENLVSNFDERYSSIPVDERLKC